MPRVEIEEDKFEEIWGKLGAEFKSKFLMMLPAAACNSVVVSCPDYLKLDEIQQLQLPIRGYATAKRTGTSENKIEIES